MYPTPFTYHRASSLADARMLLAEHPGAKLLAGGHSLIPLLKLRLATPETLVDIGRVSELRGIMRQGDTLRVGALSTHAEIAASEAVRTACPALAESASHVGDAQVRNRGTIGGNIAHADPASDLPTVLVAHEASIVVHAASGDRRLPAAGFFQGLMATALEDGDIISAVEVPAMATGTGSAYVKFVHPASRYAVLGVAAAVTLNGGICRSARIAIGGVIPAPRRVAAVEAALTGKPLTPETISAAASAVIPELGTDLLGDLFASAEYRKAVAHVYVERAVATAAARAA